MHLMIDLDANLSKCRHILQVYGNILKENEYCKVIIKNHFKKELNMKEENEKNVYVIYVINCIM